MAMVDEGRGRSCMAGSGLHRKGDEVDRKKLRDLLRGRVRATTNPRGPGHNWVRSIVVLDKDLPPDDDAIDLYWRARLATHMNSIAEDYVKQGLDSGGAEGESTKPR